MQPDPAARVLLALILVCLVILIVQGFQGGGSAGDPGRYSLTGMRAGAPVLVRLDTATGEAWKLPLRDGKRWERFEEPDEPGADGDAPTAAEPAPTD